MSFHAVARLDDLWDGEMAGVQVGSRKILLVNVGGVISAFEDRCAHQAYPMSAGRLADGVLTCSAHEWTYDARTGRGINPASARLKPMRVKIEEGLILVDPEGGEDG